MGGLLSKLISLGAYLCVATVVAALAGVIYSRTAAD